MQPTGAPGQGWDLGSSAVCRGPMPSSAGASELSFREVSSHGSALLSHPLACLFAGLSLPLKSPRRLSTVLSPAGPAVCAAFGTWIIALPKPLPTEASVHYKPPSATPSVPENASALVQGPHVSSRTRPQPAASENVLSSVSHVCPQQDLILQLRLTFALVQAVVAFATCRQA